MTLVLLMVAVGGLAGWFIMRQRGRAPAEAPAPAAAPETASAKASAAPDPGLALVAEARALQQQGNLLEARARAWSALDRSENAVARSEAETLLGALSTNLVFHPYDMPEKVEYVVQPGDTLAALAKRYGTTVELIRKGNNLSGSVIRVGDRLRILTGAFSIEVSKSGNDLALFLNDRFFKRYRVGTGAYGKTPVGDFKITDKIPQPTWWRPDGREIPYGDPENLLGTHWLALDVRGYGIHGTWEPETIGHAASAGCVRMLNDEVEELFTLVPVGTPVRIIE